MIRASQGSDQSIGTRLNSAEYTLMSSRGAVLFYVASNPSARIREIADELGLTERRVSHILFELRRDGFIDCRRKGRRNQYVVAAESCFDHPPISDIPLGVVLAAIARYRSDTKASQPLA